ncbi:hypothetical protein CSA08_01400 [Candidatus Gracilibacteria bacterium]|nr:MAG: hypothetical protein CSA08_01400 [Candidatus Gracilibacteria bacterium]
MNKNKILKLKKYLFLISVIFLFFSTLHLSYVYLHTDSKLIPLKGGAVSEGIIGDIPKLNPLLPASGNDKYIISLLYRSLMKYDIKEKKIISDIASCDINNLQKIECYLENNVYWSDGEEITIKDIVSTYNIFINKPDVNPIMSSLLSETEIIEKESSIVFKNSAKDINFLNIFFQPILPKKVTNNLGEKELLQNFSPLDGIYSGRYKIGAINQGIEAGISKIILEKNENFQNNDIFIDKLIFKVYPETSVFLKHKDTVNLFSDKNNIVGNSVPRLKPYNYTLPQYVSLFLNTEKIQNSDLRNYLLNIVNKDNLIKVLGKNNYKQVQNPYLTEISIGKTLKNKNISKIIEGLGYSKKPAIIKKFIKTSKDNLVYSKEVSIKNSGTGASLEEETNESKGKNIILDSLDDVNISFDKDIQQDSKVIYSPSYVDKYNFITKEVLLKATVEKGVEEVYINDEKVENFNSGDTFFNYSLSVKEGTLKTGENKYKIYFVKDREKVYIEEINFLYYKDKKELKKQEDLFIKKLVNNKKSEILQKNKSNNIELIKSKESAIKSMEKDPKYIDNLNTLKKLEDHYYYDKDLNKFTLKLFYVNSEKSISQTAEFIQNTFASAGIDVELYPISLKSLPSILAEKEQRYDMLLAGINLGYFDSNIFPYFHSSQVEKGYNFSNFKKLSLDLLLEELKGNILSKDKILELEKKVLEILKEEQIVKVLYTPIINNLVDKNIKNYFLEDYIPNKELRIEALNNSFILEKKIIKVKDKSFLGFLKFLFTSLND